MEVPLGCAVFSSAVAVGGDGSWRLGSNERRDRRPHAEHLPLPLLILARLVQEWWGWRERRYEHESAFVLDFDHLSKLTFIWRPKMLILLCPLVIWLFLA